jgi:hypothetical protein
MAQGKAYTEKEKEIILESLRPHLELGFSRSKACKLVGLDETTLSKWASSSEALSMKLTSWENMTSAIAMANIQMAIRKEAMSEDDVRKENSWKWAQTKEETMRPKQDITTDDMPINVTDLTDDQLDRIIAKRKGRKTPDSEESVN